MKVIDLLNKIANEKKYPKIKFNNNVYKYHDKEHGYCRYYHDNTYICLTSEYYFFDILNDEVEIIEDDKEGNKIKKLDFMTAETQKEKNRLIKDKINEIIDKLNERDKDV